ncbi:MAG: PRD domain-containing protein [Carnobacterium sp.]|uniref:PRD domain-containing protein n=1 Tax=Carnobacterium sp. TaxID=48221 RepID=UPI002FC9229F
MKIKKVFNQNAVLVVDGTTEKVAIGKGIGFNKKKNDLVFDYDIEQLFIMENEQENFQQLLSQIDESYFFASERIIEHAEHALKEKLNEHIHIALGDHIAFAMDRLKNGIVVRNKLRKEIEVLYAEEFLIAEWAIEYLSTQFGSVFTLDEAAYIAIHIHSARTGEYGNSKSIREITMVSEMARVVGEELVLDFNQADLSLSYSRLVTHLRFVLERFYTKKYHTMDLEVLAIIKKNYHASYQIALKVAEMMKQDFNVVLPDDELGYITIHIERLSGLKNI